MWHGATEGTSARAESNLTWLSCEPALIFRYGSVPRRSGEQRKTHEISCYEWANMLGVREPDIYGKQDYKALCQLVRDTAAELGDEVELFQSNHEGALVDRIQEAFGKTDAIVINPAAYTHTSVALLDALKAVGIPYVEVHISDVTKREDFRQVSFVRQAALKTIMGQGIEGYRQAMLFLHDHLAK